VGNDFFTDDSKSKRSFPVDLYALRIGWLLQGNDQITNPANNPDGQNLLHEILQSDNLEFFQNRTIQIITEFLYLNLKNFLVFYMFPLYILSLATFMLLGWFNEDYRSYLDFDFEKNKVTGFFNQEKERLMLLVLVWINLFLTFVQAWIQYKVMKGMGSKYFKRIYTWMDFGLVFVNDSLFVLFEQVISVGAEEEYNAYRDFTVGMRLIIVIGIIVQYLKLGYFLSLVDQIAPMIDIVYRIVYDIGWFVIVLLVMTFAFTYAFYILAQSQIEFDNISTLEKPIPTLTLYGAILWMFELVNGNTNTEHFELGEGQNKSVLYLIYFAAVFIFMIHLMNMLIAIMGNTYAIRNEVHLEI